MTLLKLLLCESLGATVLLAERFPECISVALINKWTTCIVG